MKTFAGLAFAAALTACLDTGSSTTPDPSTALPYDAHFVAVVSPYASPEECLAKAPQPFTCTWSLSLCKSGRAGERAGDLVLAGAYDMVDSVAHVSFAGGGTLEFDVDAVVELGSPNARWIVDTERRWDTLQFDNIDCARP
jgi:hypothetical protein